ncbi:unnamed protein product [Cylicostephanus goldi]|uniref:PARP-type domain-containing protein n=1 Tax=Cylicostephanus goldi TaxID=71465 RepID=A0A3P6SDM0_CYLGO|nr:unnamed protein product [Cylicostephanus goldi]
MGQDTSEGRSLPFGVEYARSSRSTCKGCKHPIQQDTLRMSVREPSRFFDGLQDNWFHFACFWKRVASGKEKIREKIAEMANIEANINSFSAITVEYAKSSRGKCTKCKVKIEKKEIRFSNSNTWYHQACFFGEQKYEGKVTDINGFSNLSSEDQVTLEKALDEFRKIEETVVETQNDKKEKSR